MAVDIQERPRAAIPLVSNPKARSLFFQALVLGALGAFIAFIIHNTAANLEQRGIATGFGFLSQPAGYDIAFSIFIPFDETATHGRIFWIGLVNTAFIAFLGIIAATVLGFIFGVLRLSPNWLINRLAYCYIEGLRNVPVLLQILLWVGVLWSMPSVRQSIDLFGAFFINNRGVFVPRPVFEEGFALVPAVFVLAIVASVMLRRWSRRRQMQTGEYFPFILPSIAMIIGLPILALLVTGVPLSWDIPVLKGFNFTGGGVVKPEFMALWLALSIYTSAFIAEIVRAGILSVSHGQTEAAFALGIKPNITMRLVILPQALRVIVPPLTSQFLNLTKNSSLAVAIGYPDLVATFGGTSLNQTGQAVEIIAMVMAVYLGFSLLISAFMNWYNRKIALISER